MIVIKYGGNALPDQNTSDPVLEAIADAFLDGEQIVLVHGGGPQIDAALAAGKITTTQASAQKAKTTERVTNMVNKVKEFGKKGHGKGSKASTISFKAA